MTNGNGTAPERMAPHSVEAEESVLGSILLDPGSLYEVVHFLNAADFFMVRNEMVYAAILAVDERGEEIDNISVVEELREQDRLADVGGPAYITYLINHTPASIYTETYGRIVERAAIRRRMLKAASEIAQAAQEETVDIDDALAKGDQAWDNAAQRKSDNTTASVRDVVPGVVDTIRERTRRFRAKEAPETVQTGLADLDRITYGFGLAQHIVIAGPPGAGKSALMITIVYNMGKRGDPCALMSLEMSKAEITERLIAIDTGISTSKMQTGDLTDAEIQEIEASQKRIEHMPIILDDEPSPSMRSLRMKARRWVAKFSIKALFTDYMQLFDGIGETREAEVSYISRRHKALARELNIPVIAGAQINREFSKRSDKRPQLFDLRESGAIEQNADKVIFIYRDEMFNENTERPNQADLIVAKHRNGPTGTANTYYRKDVTEFSNLSRVEVDYSQYGDGYRNEKPEPLDDDLLRGY